MRRALLLLSLVGPLWGQPAVAPSDALVGKRSGEQWAGYRIIQSWEIGYRLSSTGGNDGKYRSDVNYGNGIRLLSGRFAMTSNDGHGRWFDELLLNTQGLGNDPYESATFRIQKNKWYRYDALWRRNDYFNPALPIAGGQHLEDTVRRMQDHDFTLFPQSKVMFFTGFSRNTQSGPGLSTVALTGSTGPVTPLMLDIGRSQNEFRYGNEFRIASIRINWMGAQEWFREELPAQSSQPAGPQVSRSQVYEGTTPSWRLSFFREQGEKWAINGRGSYSRGLRNYDTQETATGVQAASPSRAIQTVVGGVARRPVLTGNLTLSLFPTSRLTITNQTAYHDVRMYGDSLYSQLENSTLLQSLIYFQTLGIRTLTNAATVDFVILRGLSLRGGYQYSERRIQSVERNTENFEGGFTELETGDQTNRLHSGMAGLRLQPVKGVTILLDGEIGRQDHPFTPISDKNYHGLSARAQWRGRSFTLGALAQANYNFNSISLSHHSSRTRRYSVEGSWSPRSSISIEASYTRLHLDTATGLAYFVSLRPVAGESLFFSNVHSAYAGVRLSMIKRADLYFGYTGTFDTGDGRAAPGSSAFQQVQTYPMSYQSPLARLSVLITSKLRWNVGYQYYGYHEDLYSYQNYHAHTGYTSLLFTF